MSTIKKKKQNNKKYITIMIISFIIMIVAIILIVKMATKSEKKENSTIANSSGYEETEENIEEEIKSMSETRRIKRYIGIFLQNIEDGKYQEAYDVLNEEFKLNYFPTIESFTEYAQKHLDSTTFAITYDNIERLGNNKTGNMYTVQVTITDIFQPKLEEDEKLESSYFVVIEYDYNDYEMSFSVEDEE
ncbi:MAG: hypothetical protein ACI4VN_04900 [Clostridia bacterium]